MIIKKESDKHVRVRRKHKSTSSFKTKTTRIG